MFWKLSLRRQGACMFEAGEPQFISGPSNFLLLWHRFSAICSWRPGPYLASSSLFLTLSLSHHCYCSLPGVVIGCVNILYSALWMQTRRGSGCSMCPAGIFGWGKNEAILNQGGSIMVCWVGDTVRPLAHLQFKYQVRHVGMEVEVSWGSPVYHHLGPWTMGREIDFFTPCWGTTLSFCTGNSTNYVAGLVSAISCLSLL